MRFRECWSRGPAPAPPAQQQRRRRGRHQRPQGLLASPARCLDAWAGQRNPLPVSHSQQNWRLSLEDGRQQVELPLQMRPELQYSFEGSVLDGLWLLMLPPQPAVVWDG